MYIDKTQDVFAIARQKMLKHDLMGRDITDRAVLSVMSEIRREVFVPAAYQAKAYADCPLPIGMDQTISQPYIVALMTQELRLNQNCRVLEVGTGSGYQTAILSRLAEKVCTIERFAELSEAAQASLGKLGIDNVEFHIGDGSCGWPFFADATKDKPEKQTFDRIIITAAVPQVPAPLIEQLSQGGLLVAPVGFDAAQQLVTCRKTKSKIIEMPVCGVRFVRLFGKYAFKEGSD
jgi:protein-L-isoaspartate(D-aspartate) O-methyltransferase